MKSKIENFLFYFQIVIAWVFSVPQILRMTQNTEGVTTTLYLMFLAFLGVNLTLAVRAYVAVREKSRLQAMIIYANWVLLIVAHVVIAVINVPWRDNDERFLIFAIIATATVYFTAKTFFKVGYEDSIVRGIIALICKAGPQLYLASCILADGSGAGMAPTTIWVGHVSVLTRIAHIVYCAIGKGKADRNLIGILVAEGGNELSWIAVTAAWLYSK